METVNSNPNPKRSAESEVGAQKRIDFSRGTELDPMSSDSLIFFQEWYPNSLSMDTGLPGSHVQQHRAEQN